MTGVIDWSEWDSLFDPQAEPVTLPSALPVPHLW